VTKAERAGYEQEMADYFDTHAEEFPGIEYNGFTGFEPDPDDPEMLTVQSRSEQPFYMPIHFFEPPAHTGSVAHLDLYSILVERPTIKEALRTWQPVLTPRLILVQNGADDGYSVILYHPGAAMPDELKMKPRDLSNMIIQIRALLTRATNLESEGLGVYLYDSSLTQVDGAPPEFLGGISARVSSGVIELVHYNETEYSEIPRSGLYYEESMEIGSRIWTVVVVAVDDSFEADLSFVILGGTIIFGASVLLAIWMIKNMRRSIQMHRVITKAAAEAAIVSDLFPAKIRERMIKDAAERKEKVGVSTRKQDIFLNDGKGSSKLCVDRLNNYLTSEGIFGSKPIAEVSDTHVL
jgi:hypothetical protein